MKLNLISSYSLLLLVLGPTLTSAEAADKSVHNAKRKPSATTTIFDCYANLVFVRGKHKDSEDAFERLRSRFVPFRFGAVFEPDPTDQYLKVLISSSETDLQWAQIDIKRASLEVALGADRSLIYEVEQLGCKASSLNLN